MQHDEKFLPTLRQGCVDATEGNAFGERSAFGSIELFKRTGNSLTYLAGQGLAQAGIFSNPSSQRATLG